MTETTPELNKRCGSCGETKPLDLFYQSHTGPRAGRVGSHCITCTGRKVRDKYRLRGEDARREKREWTNIIRLRRIPVINAIKLKSGCVDCGYNARPEALQFDHVDPATKLFGIARGMTYSIEMIMAEIAKCEVRCANCHAIRSMREGHLGRPRIDG